jgi:hypothetical protein
MAGLLMQRRWQSPCLRSLLERTMEAGIGPAAGLSHGIVEHERTVTPSGAAKASASCLASWENCGAMPSHLTSLIRDHLFTLPSSRQVRDPFRTTLGLEMYQPDC